MTHPPAGIILAGGQSRRMGGGDKCLIDLGGQPIVAHVIARLNAAAINANGDPARFAAFGLPVLADTLPDFPGPLAGVLAGMEWAAARGHGRIITAAADTPFLPRDLAARLATDAPIAMATHAGQDHPAFAVWDVRLRDDLRAALLAGTRRMRDWMDAHGAIRVEVPESADGADPFFNINTPADLAEARLRLAASQDSRLAAERDKWI